MAAVLAIASAAPTPTLRSLAESRGRFIGAAANYGYLTDTATSEPPADAANYTRVLGSDFNILTCENALKFKATESTGRGEFNFTHGDALVGFAAQHNMTVRGHNLIWIAHNPTWLAQQSKSMSAAELESIMEEHIAAVGAHYAGKVYSWDVVNEPVVDVPQVHKCFSWDCALKGSAHGEHMPSNPDAVDWTILGTGYIEQAFRLARKADATAKLFLNEYGIHGTNDKANYTRMLLQHLRDVGAPLDGIGVQMHIDTSHAAKNYSSSEFAEVLSWYAALDLDIHLTELSLKPTDPIYSGLDAAAKLAAQAELFADVLRVCLAQPRCKSYELWGFTDAHNFLGAHLAPPGAFLYDDSYVAKPSRAAIADAFRSA